MNYDDSSDSFEPRVNELADEFAARIRRGERPTIDEYLAQNPELQSQIRKVFPALQTIELALFESQDSDQPGQRGNENSAPDPVNTTEKIVRVGEYEIVDQIGRGGMGVVYLARHPQLKRNVALKILPQQLAVRPDMIDRFRREAQAVARLTHSNIIPIHEVGFEKAVAESGASHELHFMTMQYIEGPSLDRVINYLRSNMVNSQSTRRDNDQQTFRPAIAPRHDQTSTRVAGTFQQDVQQARSTIKPGVQSDTNLDEMRRNAESYAAPPFVSDLMSSNHNRWRFVARIGIDAAEALAHAHQQDVLHRDIKPSNLILDLGGKTWVSDFGLAKLVDVDASATQGIVGTLRFMPPERFDGWSDPRSDVYSLGMTLYELAVLRPAIDGQDRTAVMQSIAAGAVTAPRRIDNRIPRDLETIILKSIATESSDRYQTAAALRDDLQNWLDVKPISARRASTIEKLGQWSRRNPLIAGLTGLVILLLLVVTIGSTLTAFQLNDLADELESEKDDATRQLLLAYQSEARAHSLSRRPGHRTRALNAVQHAADLLPSVQHDRDDVLRLRNTTIAALALADVQLETTHEVSSFGGAISPCGRYLAWVDQSLTAHCRALESGKEIWSDALVEAGDYDDVRLFFSGHGNFLAVHLQHVARYPKNRLSLFHSSDGRRLLELERVGDGNAQTVAFSPDEKMMAVKHHHRITPENKDHYAKHGGAHPARIYLLDHPKSPPTEIREFDPFNRLFFDRTGEVLFGYDQFSFQDRFGVFYLNTKKVMARRRLADGIHTMAFDPNGDWMAMGCTNGRLFKTNWPSAKKWLIDLPGSTGSVEHLQIDPRSAYVLSQSDSDVSQLSNFRTGNPIVDFWASRARFFDKGKQIFAIGNQQVLQYSLIDTRPHFVSTSSPIGFWPYSMELSPCGEFIVTAGAYRYVDPQFDFDGIQIWNAKTLELLRVIDTMLPDRRKELSNRKKELNQPAFSDANNIAFDSTGRLLGRRHGRVVSWKLAKTKSGLTVDKQKEMWNATADHIKGGEYFWIDASSTGNVLAWSDPMNHEIHIGSTSDQRVVASIKTRQSPWNIGCKLSPDGSILAIADYSLRLFDTTDGTLIHDFGERLLSKGKSEIRFHPNASQLIINVESKYHLIDFHSRKVLRRFPSESFFAGADWSSDGQLLALARDQETIVMVDANTFDEIARLKTPVRKKIEAIRFGFEDNSIVAIVGKSQIHRWDLKSIREELKKYRLDW